MDGLKRIKSGKGRVCIRAVYNSGRKATVRVHLDNPDMIHISIETDPVRPYQSVADGYLHLEDTVGVVAGCTYDNWPEMRAVLEDEAASQRKAVAAINAAYFSKTLTVLSDSTEVAQRWVKMRRSAGQFIAQVWQAATDSTDLFGDIGKPTFHERVQRVRAALRPIMQLEEFIRPLSAAYLGGSWQKFSPDGWIDTLIQSSSQPVYLV